jgi:hypothetical protein
MAITALSLTAGVGDAGRLLCCDLVHVDATAPLSMLCL